jgi:hypothetical protein
MNATQYARFYGISPVLIPIMEFLNPKDYHFLRGKVQEDGVVYVNTGYYSGSGAFSKRESIAPQLLAACKKAGFDAFMERGKSAKTERVEIVIVPTAVLKSAEINNK